MSSATAGSAPCDIVPFHPGRNATLDTFRWARKRLAVTSLLEVDVTDARRAIRSYRAAAGKGLSFTAWVVACVARAAAEHPRVHGLRSGRRRVVLFREVDVAVLVERRVGTGAGAETMPMPVVVRAADRRTAGEIHDELRAARSAEVQEGAVSIGGPGAFLQSLFFRLPAWARDLVLWRWLFRSPWRVKRAMGTVVVTAIGMATPGVLAWGVPVAVHPLAVGVGGLARRDTGSGEREILALTLVFDHAVIDGAPAGRFVHRLHQLLAGAHGLTPADARSPVRPRR